MLDISIIRSYYIGILLVDLGELLKFGILLVLKTDINLLKFVIFPKFSILLIGLYFY